MVDSVSIKMSKERYLDYGQWDYLAMESDSFSTGLLKSSLQREWSSNSWVNYKYDSFIYTGGLRNTWVSQSWDTTHWINFQKWTYSYSPSIDSAVLQSWNSAWLNDLLSIDYLNSIGLDSMILTQQWRNSNWANLKKQENVYAVDSSFLSQTFSSWDTTSSQWNFTRRALWLKDSLGNDTANIFQNFISGSWKNYFGFFYHYLNGVVADQYDFSWSDFDSSFSDINTISTFTYDSLGRHIYDYIDGFPGGFGTYTYTYDSAGFLVDLLDHYETQGGLIHEVDTQWIFTSYPNSSSIYLFAIDDTISICGNDSVPAGFFAIGGIAPLHFQWTPINAVDNDTIENPYFVADTSSLLTVTVIDAAANSVMDSIFLKVNQPPSILSVQAIASCIGCNNGMFVMNVTNGGTPLYYYSLTPSVGIIPLTDTIMGLAPGVYTICLYDRNRCSVCIVDTILDENMLVSETNKELIKISPNPTTGHLIIDLPNLSALTEVVITNTYGQEVNRIKCSNTFKLEMEIKGESGIYFVKVLSGDKASVFRIVKL